MRKLLGLIVLAIVAVLAIAQFGPSALLGEETTRQDSRPAPEFSGISAWLNSPPLTMESLRGKVVLVQFWTYSCINCLRTLPYVTRWHEQYKDKGLVVVGVHTPEFAFEKERAKCRDRHQAPRHPLSGGTGQSVPHLARLRKSVLAGRVSDRQVRHDRRDAVW